MADKPEETKPEDTKRVTKRVELPYETEAPSPRYSATTTEKGKQRVDAVWAYLREKWGDPMPPCPYCRVTDWAVDPVPVLLQRVGGPHGQFGPPAFIVYCDNCGHVVLLPVAAMDETLWGTLSEIEAEELGLSDEEFQEKAGS